MNSAFPPRPLRRRPPRALRSLLATVATTIIVLAWLVAAGVLGSRPGGTLTVPGPAPPGSMVAVARTSYLVQPGDTLWSIARSLEPTGDVRPLVDHLARGTGDRPLRPGERIPLP